MTIAAALGLLLLTETGVPIPIPGDLMMLLVGERSSAGELPLWVAVLALEIITVAGTVALFVASRGPARALIQRVGPRVGLTDERQQRIATLVGKPATVALGRMTPGTRTITVIGCATSPLPWRDTLPALIVGSTLFVQAHFLLGYLAGPVARDLLERARGPFLLALGLLIVGGITLWAVRRGWRRGGQSFAEACCPACLAAGLIPGVDRSARV